MKSIQIRLRHQYYPLNGQREVNPSESALHARETLPPRPLGGKQSFRTRHGHVSTVSEPANTFFLSSVAQQKVEQENFTIITTPLSVVPRVTEQTLTCLRVECPRYLATTTTFATPLLGSRSGDWTSLNKPAVAPRENKNRESAERGSSNEAEDDNGL
jgi:hypothetical protein